MKYIPSLALLFLSPCLAPAAVVVSSGPLNTLIPDDSNTGVVSSILFPDSLTVDGIAVSLSIGVVDTDPGWLGDLYAYVRHDSGISVLLNRPGRDDTRVAGYSDDQGAQLTFSDDATDGDVHNYRLSLFGDESVALGAPLTGLWQPDGRAVDPGQVVSGDVPTAPLGLFRGEDASGSWTLFLADLSGGGQFRLDEWSVAVQSGAVPEPGVTGSVVLLALAGWLGSRLGREKKGSERRLSGS